MFEALRRHPFAVEAYFEWSLVLTYALPRSVLAPLLATGLELDCYDEWGFLAIALVQTRELRPKGAPKWLGQRFLLSGYRIFARFARPGKQSLRGLCILRSDTDRRSMVWLGNAFTRYHYRKAKVELTTSDDRIEVKLHTPHSEADLHVTADLTSRPAPLPPSSPFRTLAEARSFAGPLPYTFSYDASVGKMVVIRGLRKAWDPEPVQVDVKRASYLERAPFAGSAARLANAFYVKGIPYAWKAGKLEAIR